MPLFYIFLPYFKKRINNIKVSDVAAWQNTLLNTEEENGENPIAYDQWKEKMEYVEGYFALIDKLRFSPKPNYMMTIFHNCVEK